MTDLRDQLAELYRACGLTHEADNLRSGVRMVSYETLYNIRPMLPAEHYEQWRKLIKAFKREVQA